MREGCLGIMSIFGKTTPQGIEEALPTNSALTKFDIRPKKIPIGDTQAMSSKKKVEILFFAKRCVAFHAKPHEMTFSFPNFKMLNEFDKIQYYKKEPVYCTSYNY